MKGTLSPLADGAADVQYVLDKASETNAAHIVSLKIAVNNLFIESDEQYRTSYSGRR